MCRAAGAGADPRPLPCLDRQKVGDFLLERKRRIAFRDGKWIPKDKIPNGLYMELQFVQEMIGELVAGKFDKAEVS